MASKGPMGFVRSNRRILSKGPLQAVTPVPAAPRPHRQPFDTSHLGGLSCLPIVLSLTGPADACMNGRDASSAVAATLW